MYNLLKAIGIAVPMSMSPSDVNSMVDDEEYKYTSPENEAETIPYDTGGVITQLPFESAKERKQYSSPVEGVDVEAGILGGVPTEVGPKPVDVEAGVLGGQWTDPVEDKEDKEGDLFDAFFAAEMRSEKDRAQPYIRTNYRDAKGGSTAYGPVQITKTLVDDYIDRKSKLFEEDELVFLDKMSKQGAKFNKSGNESKETYKDFDVNFDYGGAGDLIQTEEDEAMYKKVATKMLQNHLDEADGDIDKAIEKWRGKDETEDPEYFKIVREFLAKNKKAK